MKNSSDTIGNRTRDLPACSAVPQPTEPPGAAMTPQCIFQLLVQEEVMLFEADCWLCVCQQSGTFQQTDTDTGIIRKEYLHCIYADQKTESVTRLSREPVNIQQSVAHLRNDRLRQRNRAV